MKFSPGPWFRRIHCIPFALLIALLFSIFGDFFYYWFHRWQHSCRWLWPMHELHHEDENVNVTTGFKFHWMDSLADATFQVLPTIFLPGRFLTIPMLSFVSILRVSFEHLAIPLHLGPFHPRSCLPCKPPHSSLEIARALQPELRGCVAILGCDFRNLP